MPVTSSISLSYRGLSVFVDPGRGAYGDSGEAAYFGSALAHNVVMVDHQDPYPANRPYYGDAFRRLLGGDPPELRHNGDTVSLTHHGFGRLAGAGAVRRSGNGCS